MARRYIWLFILLGVLSLGYWPRSHAGGAVSTPVIEYKIVHFGTAANGSQLAAEKLLGELGAQGWDLVTVTPNRIGVTDFEAVYYLKRVKR